MPVAQERFFHWVGRHDMIIKVATSKCGGGTTAATDAAMEGRADCGLGLGVCGTFLRYSTCKYIQ